jgi:hypothetical protein
LGELQEVNAPPSREHSNVESSSEEEKVKVAEREFVGLEGYELIAVSGGTVSLTNQV